MPYNNLVPGHYNMAGRLAAELVAEQLDELVTFIASPPATARGLAARLRYLAGTRGSEALRRAGVAVTPRTLARWRAGSQRPTPANRARVDLAYRTLRRRNVADHLARRLGRAGRGTQVEIHPGDTSGVDPRHQRAGVAGFRRVTVRHWEGIVDAWAVGDLDELRGEVEDAVLEPLGSDWGAYEYSTGVGFAA
ncbi:transcriptional regulator [Mangrovactinospora gilvigrisea]|uniref:Transcriptional regulator n=1 Tax=Mangrovactinospora gilvigrisea TaxID=1428644 RepID=A0A1J7BZ31_9ACTN|nr:transcriptional regulator [Mangrovactinospora gilvigrisea]OIV38737.1 transcriptional regulator [Mangrovactinospora gilvigrisea]